MKNENIISNKMEETYYQKNKDKILEQSKIYYEKIK